LTASQSDAAQPGEAAALTLNQQSTGVSLFHEIQLHWSLQKEPRLMLKNPPVKAGVTVNDKKTCYGCRLRDGDVLGFKSSEGTHHRYRVRISQQAEAEARMETKTETGTGTTPRKRPASNRSGNVTSLDEQEDHTSSLLRRPPPPLAAEHFSAAAEEMSCAVCLEIQYQSTTLVPCGHSLCRTCVPVTGKPPSASAPASCPVCRAAFQHQVPNRTIDNAISALARCPGFFNPDDLDAYVARSGKDKDLPSSSLARNRRHASAAGSRGRRRRMLRQELQGLGSSSEDAICVD
jgi:hypothetical protein